ncbi:MAG: bifunctional UDP-N-acetylglucosamine diphosphorylase/glucosamine-1-phosphate N-acetyltransferase GlmU [Nitrospira sp. SB0677_bin_15]|nr:bifunctional UDP-N-acetylglucosamine diphosphorylase/glucosamine-1-phosphate N-acetyltransferase GlmU [Nitrospira sp. SB0667_bin_9]MYD31851.1 bifunctional UDP-N-acetylglucosamine diphosphorylase/glucosamine-1-phosphate N-acetyltransferase GlmU [Nitrospira sp. SB0661_bin_20]MYG40145.1 bifunctional UDP-N-acetylglucosamine diphosphorylase/glucosamine-1-phosphate N-acetyltransferase GlmU [Nitrospira sp. SB0677_bin_15]MYJ22633.1 bifunctional UDP-N-acetylglucosamine diphosphorylase/glucosamine-1-ph
MKKFSAIVIAAGRGTRMRSRTTKALHPVAGRSMLWYMLSLARRVADARVVVIIGHQADRVRAFLAQSKADFEPFDVALQPEQLGTGHAVRQAQAALMPNGKAASRHCLIVNADTPLLSRATVQRLLARHEKEKAVLTLLSTELSNPRGYGRVVRGEKGQVVKVVEEADATRSERAIHEVNAGTYVVDTSFLFKALSRVRAQNAQGEYYLTDVVGLAAAEGRRVAGLKTSDSQECLGVNTREHLADVEEAMRHRIRARWLSAGVTMLDPRTTFIDDTVMIGMDTVLHPGVTLEGQTNIGPGCVIRSASRITNSVIGKAVTIQDSSVVDQAVIEDHATIGPFAHIRPGAVLRKQSKVGNFVEVKNTELGAGSKANHLTYLGDTTVGKRVNIGAGTITCNYDGYKKDRTTIEDEAFIGSDVQLLAPVRVGKGAVVGSGSTITEDVPSDALVLSRSPQVTKEEWAAKRRAYHAKEPSPEPKTTTSSRRGKKGNE